MLERDYGIRAGAKLIARVHREMKLRTNYRHPDTSRPAKQGDGKGRQGKRHTCLLRETPPAEVDDAWTSDITYLQIGRRNLYLCCVMDWTSREVLGWELGWSMETGLCTAALEMALSSGRKPKVFNTDQGAGTHLGNGRGRWRGAASP